MRIRQLVTALAAAALLAPAAVSAQGTNSASIQATANVLAPLTVNPGNNLLFNSVIPGIDMTVLATDANAGSFVVSGFGALEVQLDFGTLPSNLVSGSDNLAISFASDAGLWDNGSSTTAFDPNSASNANLAGGALTVFLGGTVSPLVSQPAGTYSGTVSLTVTYTGN